MKTDTKIKLLAILVVAICLAGCGGGGNGSSMTGGQTNNSYVFGERLGAAVSMQPAPPSYSFPAWSGTAPGIRIDQVTQFSSTVNAAGTDIYQGTTQVVFGQVTGPTAGKVVILYANTTTNFIQPLTSTTININGESEWIAPANAGQVTALLVAQGYNAPATTSTLPAVDGVNVFAVANASGNIDVSQFAFTEYPIPTANGGPASIVTGADGALWFTENNADQIGRVTTSGAVSEYRVPTTSAAPNGIAAGADGALWFAESHANQIGRVTTSGTVAEYPVPTAGSAPEDIAAGSDGALWFTESIGNKVARISTSGAVTEYPVPTPGSEPWSIVAGPDGALWFTESAGEKIGRVTTSGQLTEYPIPDTLGFIPNPYEIIVGADGALWFAGGPAGLGRITTAGDMTLWNIAWNNIAVGPDQMMWYAGYTGSVGVIGQFDQTEELSSFDVPAPAAPGQPSAVITGPDGALWVTDSSGYIVRFGPPA
jgi:virginiamycin B lyase